VPAPSGDSVKINPAPLVATDEFPPLPGRASWIDKNHPHCGRFRNDDVLHFWDVAPALDHRLCPNARHLWMYITARVIISFTPKYIREQSIFILQDIQMLSNTPWMLSTTRSASGGIGRKDHVLRFARDGIVDEKVFAAISRNGNLRISLARRAAEDLSSGQSLLCRKWRGDTGGAKFAVDPPGGKTQPRDPPTITPVRTLK